MKYILIIILFVSFCEYSYAEIEKSDYEIIEEHFGKIEAIYPFHYIKCYFPGEAYITIADKKIWLVTVCRPFHATRLLANEFHWKRFIGVIPNALSPIPERAR